MSVLVTGGAGYIGSHAAHALVRRSEKVVVLDNLSTGDRAFVPPQAEFVNGDAGDAELVRRLVRNFGVDAVLHFAGSISVPESIEMPLDYYDNNTCAARTLIEACIASGVGQFIFSSTAAVYGATGMSPVAEGAATNPLTPYGRSKLMVEWMLADAAHAHNFRYVALRYFNVAGVDSDGGAGQPRRQMAHLIKRVAEVAVGRADHLDVFGNDYPTSDGTAVRDYIHIRDLVEAHVLALDHLRAGGSASVFNCGYGTGASVLDVVTAFERVAARALPRRVAPRRAGDAAYVVANSTRLSETLGWRPKFNSLDVIVRSAFEWEQRANA